MPEWLLVAVGLIAILLGAVLANWRRIGKGE